MRTVRLVLSCLCLILASTAALAHSNRVPVANQPLVPVTAASFAQHGARVFKATGRRQAATMSGLNFGPAVTYNSGGYRATSAAVADVNSDGKPDLLVANYCTSYQCQDSQGVVGVLLGNEDGTFQAAVVYNSGDAGAESVAVADVNGDGKPDLLVANSNDLVEGTVGVLLGSGDGTFQAAVIYNSGGLGAFSVAVADVNGDGKPDLLVANMVQNTVGVLLGNGDGTFQTAVSYGSGGAYPASVAVADVNGDGKPDLVVANLCASGDNLCGNQTNGVVGVLLGNGDGTFQTVVAYGLGETNAQSIAVADVNGDAKPDLVVAIEDNGTAAGVGVLLGNGDGTFQGAVTYGSGGDAYRVAVADVNGDGKPDLVVANVDQSTVGVSLGNGDGTFQSAVTYGAGGYYATSAAVADVNGDGKPDLVVANQCVSSRCANGGTVGVLINLSTAATTTSLFSSPNPSSFDQSVTFAATVTPQKGFYKGILTGTVSFFDGTTNVGDSTLNGSGVATLPISALAVGTHSVTAAYKGDTNFALSVSTVLYQVVQDFSITLSSSSTATVSPGETAGYALNVVPEGGFNQTVMLSCSRAPAQSICSVSPSSALLNGSAPAPVTVTVITAGTSAHFAKPADFPPVGGRLALSLSFCSLPGLVMFGSFAARLRNRRRLICGLLLVCLFSLAITWLGCGGGGSSGSGGTMQGTYNLTVTGSFTSGTVVLKHAVPLTLVVQ
jgi:hypothetical protein